MNIQGLQKTSLVDYPGEICATVFVGGCNLRCRYCYNRDLVLTGRRAAGITQEKLLSFLKARSSLLGGICISGGEPTLQEGLPFFIRCVKEMGFKVKLDTNGTRPEILEGLVDEKLLDYLALDIKAPWDKYSLLTGGEEALLEIRRTVLFLLKSELDYEFRTTVVPGFLDKEDLLEIARQVAGCKKLVLQQFRPGSELLDPSLKDLKPYSPEVLKEIASECEKHVGSVQVRGL